MKTGLPPNSSARMQPIDQISTAERNQIESALSVVSYLEDGGLTSCRIPPEAEHDLGRSIPSRRDVLGQRRTEIASDTIRMEPSSETKVADLELR